MLKKKTLLLKIFTLAFFVGSITLFLLFSMGKFDHYIYPHDPYYGSPNGGPISNHNPDTLPPLKIDTLKIKRPSRQATSDRPLRMSGSKTLSAGSYYPRRPWRKQDSVRLYQELSSHDAIKIDSLSRLYNIKPYINMDTLRKKKKN